MPDFSRRIITPELMDEDDVPREKLRRSLGFIRWVNRWLGGSKVVVRHLERWTAARNRSRPVRILDVATGSADIPIAIVRWAKRAGTDVHITAIDRHDTTLSLAQEHIAASLSNEDAPCIELVQADALNLPFDANSFDYCITSMFLHHLSDIEILTVLAAMDRIAERGLIWNDLIRNRRAYTWCKLLTLFGDDIVKHDGPVSVLAGFSKREVLDIRDRLDLGYTAYHRHAFHRFTLAGER